MDVDSKFHDQHFATSSVRSFRVGRDCSARARRRGPSRLPTAFATPTPRSGRPSGWSRASSSIFDSLPDPSPECERSSPRMAPARTKLFGAAVIRRRLVPLPGLHTVDPRRSSTRSLNRSPRAGGIQRPTFSRASARPRVAGGVNLALRSRSNRTGFRLHRPEAKRWRPKKRPASRRETSGNTHPFRKKEEECFASLKPYLASTFRHY